MDFLHEGIALGVDLLILTFCVREYMGLKTTIRRIKEAPQCAIDDDLRAHVAKQPDRRIPYAILRGTVTPIGAPMHCVMAPSVTGVVQTIKLNEHRIARGFAGFWTEQRKLIHASSNDMPFELRGIGAQGVEVVGALNAGILDMDVVYDNYEPSSLSLIDHVFGFFSGVRQKGLQTTEEVLRDGSFITAVGELELDGRVLRIQPSSVGPLFLTTATKSTLMKKFDEAKTSVIIKMLFCGALSAILIGFIGRKIYLRKKEERDERRIRDTLDRERRERRALTRPRNLTEDQLCVVCSTNPKEIIVLPCGHVCICEDCSQKIKVSCPVCRSKITYRAAAFIS